MDRMSVLREARKTIDYLQNSVNFNDYVKNEVTRIYWTLLNQGTCKGFRRDRFIGAVTYYVCIREGLGVNMKEISIPLGITKWELGRTLKKIKKLTDLLGPAVPNVESLIIKNGNALKLRPETITKAIQLSKNMNRSPLVNTGLSLYLAMKELNDNSTMKKIADQLKVSESAIQAAKGKLGNNLNDH